MNFVCNPVETNALLESFEFDWTIDQQFSTSKLLCQEFASTLNGGVRFQIVILVRENSAQYDCYYGNTKRDMRVGLRKTDENRSDLKALLLFEIRNYAGQLYLKESFEKRFSEFNEEHLSDPFDYPASNREIRGRTEGLYFDGNIIIIKGKVFIQCCQEKKVSESLSITACQLQSDFKDLLRNKIYADVEFHIAKDVIHAHKNILCSRSEVFKKMFEQNMKEKEVNSVKIADIEKSVFETFLMFIYTGTIENKNIDIVMPLYSVADKYAVESLLKTCSNILINYISDTTAAPILKLADMHNDDTLKSTALDFICKNFVQVEITHSWDALLNSDPRLASHALKQVSITAAKHVLIKNETIPKKNVKAKKSPKFL